MKRPIIQRVFEDDEVPDYHHTTQDLVGKRLAIIYLSITRVESRFALDVSVQYRDRRYPFMHCSNSISSSTHTTIRDCQNPRWFIERMLQGNRDGRIAVVLE